MGIITKIEEKTAEIVERPFSGRKGIEPLIIEITLKRRLEDKKKNILGRIVVPNAITIILDETTHNEFRPFLDSLRASLREALAIWINEKGFEMLDNLEIDFVKGSPGRQAFDIVVSFKSIDKCKSGGTDASAVPLQKESVIFACRLLIPATGAIHYITRSGVVIGRDTSCDIMLDDMSASRRHAAVTVEFGKLILKDLGSSTGTRVNHEKIQKKILQDGDSIKMGNTELVVKIG